MIEYIKFAAGWVVFMLILGGVTLLVPKIAAKIDKIRQNTNKKENMFSLGQTSFMEPVETPEEGKTNNGQAEIEE